jgi:phage virion morphogenesis protein
MAGVRLELQGDDAALAVLAGYVSRARDARGMFEAIGASLVTSTQMRFERGAGPDGSPWPPSIRALATGGKTLIESARLLRSITFDASDAGVAVGTNVIYGAIHQLGGAIVQPSRGATINMPARPYLGLDDDDEVEIVKIAEEWLAGEGAAA